LENSALSGATPSTGNYKDIISCLLVLMNVGQNLSSNAMEGEPLTSECQTSSVFNDNSEEAKQEEPYALRNQMCFS
jgi:hypothetical protein